MTLQKRGADDLPGAEVQLPVDIDAFVLEDRGVHLRQQFALREVERRHDDRVSSVGSAVGELVGGCAARRHGQDADRDKDPMRSRASIVATVFGPNRGFRWLR